METAADRRKRKLDALCRELGRGAVASAAGVSEAYLDQILKGTLLPAKKDGSRSRRSLGDAAARQIEQRLKLGAGWFDAPDSPPPAAEPLGRLSEREQFLIAAWRALPSSARTTLLADVESLVLTTQNTASSVMQQLNLMRAKGDEYVATKLPAAPAAPGDRHAGGMSNFGDLGPPEAPAAPASKARVKR